MHRILVLACLIALGALAVTTASPAAAREGAYRGPGGSVPPGLREPSDPAPPPPPPPTGPPPTGPGGPPAPVPTTPSPRPPAPVPSTPPAPARPVPPPHSIQPMSFEAWPFWFEHNRDLLEAEYRRHEEPHPDPEAEEAYDVIVAAAKGEGDPHLSTRAAALIALGKVAHTPEHVAVLEDALKRGSSPFVRESAALGLGLLRRTWVPARFEAATYDRVRQLLLDTLADEGQQARTRGFAALGVGLLGGQPTEQDPAATTARLFAVLHARTPNVDVPVGVMRALTLQPRASFTAEQLTELRRMAYEGTLSGNRLPQVLRARALETLGVLGSAEDVAGMQRVLDAERGMPAAAKRSAAIALGLLAAHVPLEDRLAAVRLLLDAAAGQRDATTRTFAIGALVPALLWGEPADREAVLRRSLAPEYLLTTAMWGSALERPYAALVLGWILREWRHPPLPSPLEDLGAKARRVLREGTASPTNGARARAAFALALGMAGDEADAPALTALVADRKNDKSLRAYAAVGLAFLDPAEARIAAVSAARAERSSEELRMLATRALGMMRITDPAELAEELRVAKYVGHKGEAAAALARLGTPEARAALLRLATDPNEPAFTHAMAMAGLGRLLDPEFFPALARLTLWMNYRASTDLISQLYSIL